MNKKMILMVLVSMLLLSACSGAAIIAPNPNQGSEMDNGENVADLSNGDKNPADGDPNRSLEQSQEMVQLNSQIQLILGTMALTDSDLKLTQDQAAALLPLWKVMKTLLASDTAAGAEIEALLNQIRSVFSPQQLEWVNNFSISQAAYQEILTKYVPEEFQNTGMLMTVEEREARRATAMAANGGTIPSELQGSGGGRGMGSGGVPRNLTGEMGGQAAGPGQGASAGSGQLNVFLIDGLIAELELVANP